MNGEMTKSRVKFIGAINWLGLDDFMVMNIYAFVCVLTVSDNNGT